MLLRIPNGLTPLILVILALFFTLLTLIYSNQNQMELWAESIFDSPRSDIAFSESRDRVGGFIYQKLAQAGLMMLADQFQYVGVAMNTHTVTTESPSLRVSIFTFANLITAQVSSPNNLFYIIKSSVSS